MTPQPRFTVPPKAIKRMLKRLMTSWYIDQTVMGIGDVRMTAIKMTDDELIYAQHALHEIQNVVADEVRHRPSLR